MAKNIVNLSTETSNITEVMAGPWNDIRIEKIAPGADLELKSDSMEHACFVVAGSGTLVNGDETPFSLKAQDAFAIPAGGQVRLVADQEFTLLHIEMNLAQ